jgi:hypothetical protein
LNKLDKRHHHKRRSVSPSGIGEQGLYSDQEQQRKERREPLDGQQDRSRSQSPALASRSKQEGAADNDQQQQQSQAVEGTSVDATQGGVARSEEEQAVGDSEKRRSGSKKKKHHRRDRYDNYNIPPPQEVGHDSNPNNPFHQQPPQSAYFGEYQNELPPQLKVDYIYNKNNSFKKKHYCHF